VDRAAQNGQLRAHEILAMSDESTQKTDNKLAQRLGRSRVGLRHDLEVHRHLFRGTPSYVIRDPLTLQCHRLNLNEYEILINLTHDKSLAEVFESLVKSEQLKITDEEEFYQFIVSLHRLAFLNLPVSDDKILYRRYLAKQQARRKEKLMGFMFLRIPVINPDAFLARFSHWVKPIFHRQCFWVWLALVLAAGYIIIQKRDELWAPILNMFSTSNLFGMWSILILLKALHEFGHAFACKIFGGHVPEMGIYLIAGTPCAYVDVTSSWKFTRKRHRIMVGLAGVYVESFIASVAIFVWAFTEPSLLHTLSHQIFFLAGIVTVTMNINPLMRFDGYYILSDLLEIPNLRQRSQRYVLSILKRLVVGVKEPANSFSFSLRLILFVFGIASSLYKITVILAICTIVAMKMFLVGLVMAGVYITSILFRTLKRVIEYLWQSPQTAPVRVRAVVVSLILLIGLPVVVLLLPFSSSVQVNAQLRQENEEVVRAPSFGFVRQVHVDPSRQIRPRDLLVELENHETLEAFIDAQAQMESAQIRLKSYNYDETDPARAIQQKKITQALKSQFNVRRKELEQLNVRGKKSGIIINCLKKTEVGRFVQTGEALATIASGRWVAQTLLTEKQIAETKFHTGQKVQFRCIAQPRSSVPGTITRIAPMGSHTIENPTLTHLGGGEIPVNQHTHQANQPYFKLTVVLDQPDLDELRYGMTGNILLDTPAKPLGKSLFQKFLRFTNSLRQG
jgi:putative peptide zinc metalloprotease protein